jgi:hypothetical protein
MCFEATSQLLHGACEKLLREKAALEERRYEASGRGGSYLPIRTCSFMGQNEVKWCSILFNDTKFQNFREMINMGLFERDTFKLFKLWH